MRPSLKFSVRTFAAIAAFAVVAAGCGRAGSSSSTQASTSASASVSTSQDASTAGDFGNLKAVCHGGSATGSTDQGVTSSQIMAGVMTDVGFTKDPQVVNAAKVFTSWCNAAGGIDGRKLVADVHDAAVMNVVKATTAACGSDFVLAGGSAALDGLAVTARLKCLLPEFTAQTVMQQNNISGLQIYPIAWSHNYSPFAGYYQWLFKQYPGSSKVVGIVDGLSPMTQASDLIFEQTFKAEGATTVDHITFPVTGVTNWTPYAEEIKAKGVKALVFGGTPQSLAALEQALDNIGYKLDWIDTDPNSYGPQFTSIAGKSLTMQHNYADLPAIYPIEKAGDNPATEQLVNLYHQYAPGQPLTLQATQAWSAWLIFAASAESCGSNLTRKCVYEAALKQTDWTGGGLTGPANMAKQDSPPTCFDAEQATASGWQPATGFSPNTDGAYSCGESAVKIQGLPPAVQLSDVGLSLSDLK